ncbi:hypothetical protein HYH02_010402 [Chlamydomonas schloesseri]|uniref:Uncharacterized protein n=1 Tax=Chlamydomonas schloesseri TaxID=2026947 RepID=A0A835THM6_9CHLO|nr:hypothetical protein HYH02_010402 [Chlamydomonas schloesseri]|eukprot:KAG2440524.1 hypothetical protein HYH02_010402 [Chlamydomonas schloesseri]
MEALQQAALQGLRPVMEAEPESQPAPSTNEMLRHVGCARMRAAMLDQARERAWAEAKQGPGAVNAGAMSARSAALTAATRHAAAADDGVAVAYDNEVDGYDDDDEYYYEYYEDYGISQKQQGMIVSMVAGTVGHMLRGAFADAAEAHTSAAQQQLAQQQLAQQQLQLQQQHRAMSREELEDRIASQAALRIAAALDAAGGVARLGYEDGEADAQLVMSSSGSKAAVRNAGVRVTSVYEYDDEDEEDEDEDVYGEVTDLAEAMLSNLDTLLSGGDDNDEEEEQPAPSKGEYLREQQKKQKAALAGRTAWTSSSSSSASRASASNLDDESDDAWEDYLEQYYAYYTIYGDGGEDEEDIYDSYYESYLEPYGEAPDALDMLASLAELIAWSSHTGSLVLHLFPIGGMAAAAQQQQQQQLSPAQLQVLQLQNLQLQQLREQSAAAEVAQARAALLFPGQPYDPAAVADPIALLMGDDDESAGTIIISDLNMAWLNPDGSLNWGLVTLLILTAGTLAMAVGFVVSWISLRRTMRTAAVYPGGAAASRRACARSAAGSCSGGSECDSLDNPLLLLPEDCHGAEPLKIECASTYVPPVLPNESVAKVLCR